MQPDVIRGLISKQPMLKRASAATKLLIQCNKPNPSSNLMNTQWCIALTKNLLLLKSFIFEIILVGKQDFLPEILGKANLCLFHYIIFLFDILVCSLSHFSAVIFNWWVCMPFYWSVCVCVPVKYAISLVKNSLLSLGFFWCFFRFFFQNQTEQKVKELDYLLIVHIACPNSACFFLSHSFSYGK